MFDLTIKIVMSMVFTPWAFKYDEEMLAGKELATPEWAYGSCAYITHYVQSKFLEAGYKVATIDVATFKDQTHIWPVRRVGTHWAMYLPDEGKVVDLTFSQIDPTAPFPLVEDLEVYVSRWERHLVSKEPLPYPWGVPPNLVRDIN